MKWLELSVRVPAEYVEPLSVIFQRYGYGGVAVELSGGHNPDEGEMQPDDSEAVVRCYLQVNRTTSSRKENIQVAVDLISRLCSISPLQERVVSEKEWMESWKDHFSVLHMGRIVICPSWLEYATKPEEVVIEIDPGMAFGTGHHPTTRMCLMELDRLVTSGMRVMDVGTGSGILAMASAKLGADYILALDTDPIAIKTARTNIRSNGLKRVVDVQHRTVSAQDTGEKGFDIVVANLYTKVILEVAPALVAQIVHGGKLVVSGILADRVSEVARYLEVLGCVILRDDRDGDWALLVVSNGGG